MDTTTEAKIKAELSEVAPCRKKVEVTVPPELVDVAFDEAYTTLRDNVQIRGFRRGHAPRRMLERRFAKDVAKDVRAKLFQDQFTECMKENELSPMGEPDVDLEQLEAAPGTAFSFSTEVDVRPTFDLPDYKQLKLTEKVEPATDEEIQEQLERMRKAFAVYHEVDEASLEDDILVVDVVMSVGDEELLNEKEQRVRIEGTQLFGIECADLVKKLSKLRAGEQKSIKLKLPQEYHREELRGKQATVKFNVLRVERPELPEMDDTLAKKTGLGNLDALRERIKQNIEAERQQAARRDLEEQVSTQLIEAAKFDLPEAFLKRQTEANLMRSKLRLARMGATKELLEERAEELEKSSAEETERNLRWAIISDAIAEKEEVEITEAELQAHIEALSRSYQTTPAKMLQRLQEMNGLPALAMELRDVKVVRLILDSAEIKQEGAEDGKPKKEEKTEKEDK